MTQSDTEPARTEQQEFDPFFGQLALLLTAIGTAAVIIIVTLAVWWLL